MTARDIVRCRSVNQQIADTRSRKPHEVVAALVAIQAQDYLGALWAIGLRLPHDGVICFGPRLGKTPTFVLLDEWVPDAQSLDRDKALAELATRYFSSRGPATLQDFAWWTGLKASDAKAGLDLISSRLARATLNGKVYWLAETNSVPRKRGAYLLPSFDEWMLGYQDRSHSLDLGHWQRVVSGNGLFAPILLLGNRVAGTWKRVLKKNTVAITLDPFTPLTSSEERAVTAAAKRYRRFLGSQISPQISLIESARKS
jgi:hypothetical protein